MRRATSRLIGHLNRRIRLPRREIELIVHENFQEKKEVSGCPLFFFSYPVPFFLPPSPAPVSPARPSQVHDHGASAFPVTVLDARDRAPLHPQMMM